MSSHVDVDLTWNNVLREIFLAFIGNQCVHLLDLLLGCLSLNLTRVKSDLEVSNSLLV